METEVISASSGNFVDELVKLGAILRDGGLVAFPTETVYGLGANGLDGKAVKGIYAAKGRPSDNPLILHVTGRKDIDRLVKEVTPLEEALIHAFWPGPLTIVFPKSDLVPKETAGGLDTIAIRCPSHPAAQSLIRAAGVPLAAPSANRSGRPSPTTAEAVRHDMDGRIAAIIDGGPCQIGLESTVVGCHNGKITIYRPGGVTKEMLEAFAPTDVDKALLTGSDHPMAPGMKYRHYAPEAPLVVYSGDEEKREAAILSYGEKKDKVYGFFVSQETAAKLPAGLPIFVWGRREDQTEMAHRLFSGLLYFNTHHVDEIIGEGTGENGIGLAIMNRLTKASGYHMIVETK